MFKKIFQMKIQVVVAAISEGLCFEPWYIVQLVKWI